MTILLNGEREAVVSHQRGDGPLMRLKVVDQQRSKEVPEVMPPDALNARSVTRFPQTTAAQVGLIHHRAVFTWEHKVITTSLAPLPSAVRNKLKGQVATDWDFAVTRLTFRLTS